MVLHLAWYVWVAIFVGIELIRPKPKVEGARPESLGDFQYPTAAEGRVIPIVWGQVEIKAPNVVAYGGVFQEPHYKDIQTGIFSSTSIIEYYDTFVNSLAFALCRGPVDKFVGVKVNDKLAANGRITSGPIVISDMALLGGDNGGGGMQGAFYCNMGALNEALLTWGQLSLLPYRGTCMAEWSGTIGRSMSIPTMSFIVERIPNGLSLAIPSVNSGDANLMNVAFEILTDTEWGLAIPPAKINADNFRVAAATLLAEGNGFSMVLDREMEAIDLIHELERQMDGVFYFHKPTGQWCVTLDRNDFDVDDLLSFDESNMQLTSYARATWEETTSQVRISFSNRAENFRECVAVAQDLANYQIQGRVICSDISYAGVVEASLANKLAWRDVRTLSYPLAKAEFVANRSAYSLVPGQAFKLSDARLGIDNMVMRVLRLDYGELDQGKITISCVQDVISVTSGSFADPPASGWVDPIIPAGIIDADEILSFEAPRQVVAAGPLPTMHPRVWYGARNPGGGSVGFSSSTRMGTSRPLTGVFARESYTSIYRLAGKFLLAGSLKDDLPAYFEHHARPAVDNIFLNNNDPDDLSVLDHYGSAADVENHTHIAYIDGEFIGYEQFWYADFEEINGAHWMCNIYRGLFHTAPKAHLAGTRVWFIGQSPCGGAISVQNMGSNDEVDVKLYAFDSWGRTVLTTEPPIVSTSIAEVRNWPLAPRDPHLNTVYAPASCTLDTIHAGAGGSGHDLRSILVTVTPRDWHVMGILVDDVLSAEYLDDDPEFDFELVMGAVTSDVDTFVMASIADVPLGYIRRNKVIKALGAGVQIPATAVLLVTARHTVASAEFTGPMEFGFTLTSALQGADLIFGAFAAAGSTSVVFGETGTYAFDIHYALPSSGIVESNVNSGGWTTLIGAAATTGNLSLTANDVVQLRFSVVPATDQFFDISGPTEVGYGVLLH